MFFFFFPLWCMCVCMHLYECVCVCESMGDFMGYHKISTTRLLLPHPAHLDMLAMAAHINYAVNSLVAEWGPWLQKN